jgi:hypothetical protein
MPETETSKKYNFVIARFWDEEESDNLCCYTYGSSKWYDTKENAEILAEAITERAKILNPEEDHTYKPFYIEI